jgi:hypothetical protein
MLGVHPAKSEWLYASVRWMAANVRQFIYRQ